MTTRTSTFTRTVAATAAAASLALVASASAAPPPASTANVIATPAASAAGASAQSRECAPRSQVPPESSVFVLDRGRCSAFDAPGINANYFPRINNRGDVVGVFTQERRPEPPDVFGGYLRDPRGRLTEIAFPGAVSTVPLDVNDHREVVGNYDVNADGNLRAFMRDKHGRYSTLRIPGAGPTQALGINNRGQIVGEYLGADGVYHGYLWHKGNVTTIDGPERTGALITDINDHGDMVGVYVDSADPGVIAAFTLSKGRYTTIDIADDPGIDITLPLGLNNRGHIVGYTSYVGDDTKARGFLLREGADGPVTRIDIPGALGSGVTGINDRGQLVGRYGNNPSPSPSVARIDERPSAPMSGLPIGLGEL
jgi:probable HAF family extracellular repeat protein